MNPLRTMIVTGLAAVIVGGCDNDKNDVIAPVVVNDAPVAVAAADSVVAPDSAIMLLGSASYDNEDGDVSTYEWYVEGSDGFVPVTGGDTTITAPSSFDTDFLCVLRVADSEDATALDTAHVIVSWLRSPNGGQTYHVGDSLHIDMMHINQQVGLELIVVRDGEEYVLNIPGFTGTFYPSNQPRVSFVIPPTIYDLIDGQVSPVSDSCKIRAHDYLNHNYGVRSAGYFAIKE
ncbi:MAG: hypothetical protein GF331_13640 [Chitinivibrionales bacterium]|nr:hypothetical protein [Chitinivibrionales bacterium]